jgi:sec-independent protein translocase protein TatA
MFGSLGLPELLVILLIVIIIFGANKLPQLGKGLGQGMRNFRESMKGDEPAPPPPPPKNPGAKTS